MRTLKLLLAASLAISAHAASIYQFSWDTSSLASTNQDYILNLQLLGTAGNTVTIQNLNFGTGGSGPTASQSIDSTTQFFSELLITFTPGATLSFNLLTTNILPPGPNPIPDQVSIYLLDTSFNPVASTDAASAFALFDIGPGASIPTVFQGGPGTGLPTPVFVPDPLPNPPDSEVPEPSSLGLVSGLLALWCLGRRS